MQKTNNPRIRYNRKEDYIYIIRQALTQNIRIKLTCFILAIFMYVVIGFFQRGEKIYTVPLSVVGIKDYYVISNDIPETVRVVVKDKQNVIDMIDEKDFNVTLDLSPIDVSDTYQIEVGWEVPGQMRSFFSSLTVEPSSIFVAIDKMHEKDVPIDVAHVGTIQQGYDLKRKTITPSEILIQGPKKFVDEIKVINAKTVNVMGAKESFVRYVKLLPPHDRVSLIGPDTVEVYFEIEKETETKVFRYNKVQINNLKLQFKPIFRWLSISVTVQGPKQVVSQLNKEEIHLSIDCANILFPGTYTYPIDVTLPNDDIKLISISPKKLRITIEDRE